MDTATETAAEKKPAKKKAAKRKDKTAASPKPTTAGPFAGMSVSDCCDGCDVNGCVISGKPYCGHPRKGGLQSREIQDHAARKRLNAAKRLLGEQLLQARSD